MPRRTYTLPDGHGLGRAEPDWRPIGAFVIALSVLDVPRERDLRRRSAADRARRPVGRAARSSGRSRRRRPSTTSPRSRSSTHRDEFWHRKYTEDDEGRLRRSLPPSGAVDTDRRTATIGRAAQHPHAVAVVLAAGVRARAADPRLRLRVQELVARSRSACPVVFFGIDAWGLEPATEPDGHDERPGVGSALMAQAVVTAGTGPSRARPITDRRTPRRTPASATRSSAMWLFLSSECLFFGAFIATYFLYRGRDAAVPRGPTPAGRSSTSRSRR